MGDPLSVSYSDFNQLTRQEFQYFARLIADSTGITIEDDKTSMMQGRLNKRLRALGLSTYSDYQQYLSKSPKRKEEMQHFVNALTTNKTEFFREALHFEVLVDAISNRPSREMIYVWSGASSTGEEIYSIAMTLEELIDKGVIGDYRVLATDIDTQCLKTAQMGVYNRSEMGDVPAMYIQKYFKMHKGVRNGDLEILPRLKNKIKFRQYNLVNPETNIDVKFDFIFLRNVLFYFTKPTAQMVVNRLAGNLVPSGLLFVSLTESLSSMSVKLSHVSNSVYRKE